MHHTSIVTNSPPLIPSKIPTFIKSLSDIQNNVGTLKLKDPQTQTTPPPVTGSLATLHLKTHPKIPTWSGLSESCSLEKNSEVPDLAMVPRLLTRSLRVMPIPVSVMCRTWLSYGRFTIKVKDIVPKLNTGWLDNLNVIKLKLKMEIK